MDYLICFGESQGKEHSRWEREFFNKNVGPSYHATLCKLKKLLPSDILIPKLVVYIVVALTGDCYVTTRPEIAIVDVMQ
jgi:hypothetical protein